MLADFNLLCGMMINDRQIILDIVGLCYLQRLKDRKTDVWTVWTMSDKMQAE
jgi:hypothetical protein